MKCQAIIGNYYFDITVGFQHTHFSIRENHYVPSLSLKSVNFYLARNGMLKFLAVC